MSDVLNKASLVLIPSGYKEDKIYSVIPTSGDGDLTFTRASDATRVNSAGLVERVPWNLAQYSEDFSNAVWAQQGDVVTNNTQVAPNGTTTADTISNSAGTALFRTYQGAITGYAQPQTLTFSTYFKYKDHRYISFGITDDSDYRSQVVVDLQNMVITENYKSNSGDVLTSSIESVGNGWYKIGGTLTYNTALSGGNLYFLYKFQTSGTFSSGATSQTGTGFYIWGAQLNIGSTAKPYFPTTDRLNVPRLDYSGGSCPSLFLEPQRTNSQTYSEDLTDVTAWFVGAGTISANSTTSPDGTQNADKVIENTSTARHELYGKNLIYSGTSSISFYAKAAGRRYLSCFVGGDPSAGGVTFDLQEGTAPLTSGGTIAKIEAVTGASGWYKCSYTSTKAAITTTYFCIRQTLGTTPTVEVYTGDGTSGIYFWGGQTELNSSYPTSYIPTTSSAATRVADGPLNLSTSQTLTNFTLFYDGLILENSNNMIFGSGSSAWYIDIDGSTGRVVLDLSSGRIYSAFSVVTSNQRFKLAIKRSAGVVNAFVNGTKLTPTSQVTDTTSLTLSSIFWGFSATYYPKMKVNQICAFQTALTDSECASLTGNQNYTINQAYASYGVASESPNCVQP